MRGGGGYGRQRDCHSGRAYGRDFIQPLVSANLLHHLLVFRCPRLGPGGWIDDIFMVTFIGSPLVSRSGPGAFTPALLDEGGIVVIGCAAFRGIPLQVIISQLGHKLTLATPQATAEFSSPFLRRLRTPLPSPLARLGG